MRPNPIGRLVILILVAGLAFGAWRLYSSHSASLFAPNAAGTSGGEASPNAAVGGNRNSGANAGSGSDTVPASGTLVLVTSKTKQGWLQAQMDAFNRANQGQYSIQPDYIETREAMQAILNDKVRPVLWSPSSPIWAERLGNAYAEKHGGQRIIDQTSSSLYRSYLRTPIVFLTTKTKATFLRPLLGVPNTWTNLRDLSTGRRKAPWGRFKFSHADPVTANSGFLTLGMMFLDYAKQNGGVPSEEMAVSSGFINYLKQVETALVFDAPAQQGSTQVFSAFVSDPTRYDIITTYESNALDAAEKNPDLAVIYPEPTVLSEQAVAVINGSWVSASQREGASKFLEFLAGQSSIQSGLDQHFRTQQSSGSLSLEAELAQEQSQGFKQSMTSIELPGYMALNTAAFTWRNIIAKAKGSSAP